MTLNVKADALDIFIIFTIIKILNIFIFILFSSTKGRD